MRILHIFDTCGVASAYKALDAVNDHRIITTARNNKFGHSHGATVVGSRKLFYARCLASTPFADVAVCHINLKMAHLVGLAGRPVVLYAHGTELRLHAEEVNRDLAAGRLAHVVAATKDLTQLVNDPSRVTYIPNPISPIFTPSGAKPARVRAFTFSYGADDLALDLARAYGLNLDILNRTFTHNEIPIIFAQYSHYIDVKRDVEGRQLIHDGVLSLTALEALAAGLKVITPDGLVKQLPAEYDREASLKAFLGVVSRVRK